jgi:hypothetical protein
VPATAAEQKKGAGREKKSEEGRGALCGVLKKTSGMLKEERNPSGRFSGESLNAIDRS